MMRIYPQETNIAAACSLVFSNHCLSRKFRKPKVLETLSITLRWFRTLKIFPIKLSLPPLRLLVSRYSICLEMFVIRSSEEYSSQETDPGEHYQYGLGGSPTAVRQICQYKKNKDCSDFFDVLVTCTCKQLQVGF